MAEGQSEGIGESVCLWIAMMQTRKIRVYIIFCHIFKGEKHNDKQ